LESRAEGLEKPVEEIVYLNGSLIPLPHARLSPLDYGMLYGYGLFETMRSYSGYIFRLKEHIERLRHSAKFLGIDLSSIPELEKALYSTLQANNLSNARIRLTISGGEGETIPDLVLNQRPTVFITARSYTPYSDKTYQQGFKAIVSRIRRNTRSPVSALKSLSYLDSLLARREAKLGDADEAVLLNEQGFVAEGSTTNVFLVSDDTLSTPSEDSGILPGVTREAVLELASSLGVKAAVRRIALREVNQADEVFLTNSLIEIMPLTRFSGQTVGSGRAGKITGQLMEAYKALVLNCVVI
jgi:branched-chain amino acid aminotransferase group I